MSKNNCLKYYLFVLGCQMNVSDAQRIAKVLDNCGFKQTNKETAADIIIIVACSVRQSAIDRIYGKNRVWQQLKKKKKLLLVLTGCLLTVDQNKMSKIFDVIFDIDDLKNLPKLLHLKTKKSSDNGSYLSVTPKHSNNFQVYVPISTGCNNFCSYCVVPYTRGREISRPSKDIIKECQNLIDHGFKEITLLGQNVNSYGHDLKNDLTFPKLLQKINGLAGDFWLKFITSHPKDMSDELIEIVSISKKVCEYIHLPVQSGDNEILKKMNRGYTKEHYLNLIKKIRKKIPQAAISTDVIVGFPGETKKQFEQTVKLIKEVKFAMAYISQYSPRSQTKANLLKDDIPKKEKKKRKQILNNIINKTSFAYNKKLVNKTIEILVHKRSNKTRYYFGKTKTERHVCFPSPDDLIGQFVKIKITKAHAFCLEGKLIAK
ncbi:tRNA (N6-isopentenyl adenosine(37)-C2)-methylthiotransferase MiaB [Patescibacteria group bacterium]|nr:tRNA (N6-isopentenyl adenosine(37)-C2)-methylthiotransferase MiaB [Patescibacteria group bacterium]